MKIDGVQIAEATIPATAFVPSLQAAITAAITNGITSSPSGDYKKVVSLAYNPTTGDFLISYET